MAWVDRNAAELMLGAENITSLGGVHAEVDAGLEVGAAVGFADAVGFTAVGFGAGAVGFGDVAAGFWGAVGVGLGAGFAQADARVVPISSNASAPASAALVTLSLVIL